MNSCVTLTVHGGVLDGEELVFFKPASCMVGRARDCKVQIPNGPAFLDVSRHHCLFEIEPTNISVRDVGSLNGTFVNDCNIGQRSRNVSNENCANTEGPRVSLKDGDRVRIGPVVLGIKISTRLETAPCVTSATDGALPSPVV
jgi:pSer/pThr/pTyr-binding forkhead associated (FHA) protein